ncbi:MAG: transcription antitermination factor NusB [Gammaproteobacteria bacterium]|nr:transcription antitermination factor NusB [Gammaproteobacteria bacterium]
MAAPKLGNAEKRSIARHMAVQAMYQHELNGTGITQLLIEFRPTDEADEEDQQINAERWAADFPYFQKLLEQTFAQHDELRDQIKPLLDRAWGSLDPVEQSILLICSSELKNQMEVPFRVVVNEAVELAKDMGAEESYKYINGVMDKLAQDYRRFEVAALKG